MRILVALSLGALLAACASPVPSPSPAASPDGSAAVDASPVASAPSPSAGPSAAPVTPLNATAEARDGRFRLTLEIDHQRYQAGKPIEAEATLTFLGPEPTVTASGSGSGLVLIALEQLDGPLDPHGAGQDDCAPFDFVAGRPLLIPYVKSGGWDANGPNAAWYDAFFKDAAFRLPAGVWQLSATLDAFEGVGCIGARHQIATSVTFQVVD